MVDECMEWVPYFQAKPKVANSYFFSGWFARDILSNGLEIYVEVGWVRAHQVLWNWCNLNCLNSMKLQDLPGGCNKRQSKKGGWFKMVLNYSQIHRWMIISSIISIISSQFSGLFPLISSLFLRQESLLLRGWTMGRDEPRCFRAAEHHSGNPIHFASLLGDRKWLSQHCEGDVGGESPGDWMVINRWLTGD
jgi:hypothetical protein